MSCKLRHLNPLWWLQGMVLNLNVPQVFKRPECLKKPDYQNNNDDNIQDTFDFTIHGDVSVDKP